MKKIIGVSNWVQVAIALGAIAWGSVLWYNKVYKRQDEQLAKDVVVSWNRLFMELERFASGYRAPVSARMFAYTSLAAYEAAIPVLEGYKSLGSYYDGYAPGQFKADLPPFVVSASLNSAYAVMARKFFPGASAPLQDQIAAMERQFTEKIIGLSDETSLAYSRNFGRRTAESIWRWSQTDSIGYGGAAFCKGCAFVPDSCKGCWLPDNDHSPPLYYWGKTRPFSLKTNEIQAKPPPPYDEATDSQMFGEAMEVFTSSQPLSTDSYAISEFWSDDIAGLTVSPTGRWISIATQATEQSPKSLGQTLEMYLKLSVALCDAYIVCWDLKFRYLVERPETYIKRNIQTDWKPHAPSPPYPSYPAAHALVAGAATEVLTQAFGEPYRITDRTHEDRVEFAGSPRTYRNFRDMAKEVSLSRILLGVHFRADCEEGFRLGVLVGQKAQYLPLKGH